MKLSGLILVAAVMAANPLDLGDAASRSQYREQEARSLQQMAKGVEPAPTPVVAGSNAPDFSYQTADRRWRNLSDLLEQGAVMLVFGADERALVAIEHERDRMLDMGVVPVAIVDASGRVARNLERKLELRFPVIADPRVIIAGQFNAVDPVTRRADAHWFVVDRSGQVRLLGRDGLPEEGYAGLAARGLGIPAPDATLPSAR